MAEFTKNAQVLGEAEDVQQKTKDAMLRIQQQTAATEDLAEATLEELRAQGETMDNIQRDLDQVNSKLETTDKLQNQFDRWAGNWGGWKKSAAKKEAQEQMAGKEAVKEKGEEANIREIYEDQTFKSMGRKWKRAGLFVCDEPTKQAPDLFDPVIQATLSDTRWHIDFSQPNIDVDGWTYASDFTKLNRGDLGKSAATWKCYVRRRKWKYIERASTTSDAVDTIRARQATRQAGMIADAEQQVRSGAKIGYVPRSRQTDLQESSRTYHDPKRENLDEESKAGLDRISENDRDIDSMLDQTANSLDRLAGLAGAMKDETISHSAKLAELDGTLSQASTKQAIVNARAKRLLR